MTGVETPMQPRRARESDSAASTEAEPEPRPLRAVETTERIAEVHALGDELASLAGHLAAATARFLKLLGEFDAREGWRAYEGLRSAAHWLSWRTGMDLRTARDQLLVARRLRGLPVTAEAFGQGRLSYSKVRAIARVCTPQTEQDMVDLATHAPAAHVERLSRGLRAAARESGPEVESVLAGPPTCTQSRYGAKTRWDEETGDLLVWGRFSAADGAVVLAALTRAELERIRTTEHEGDPDDAGAGERRAPEDVPRDDVPPDAEGGNSGSSEADHAEPGGPDQAPMQRRESADLTGPAPSDVAPALVALARIGLHAVEAPAHAPAAEVVFVHSRGDLAPGAGRNCPPSAEHPASDPPDRDRLAGSDLRDGSEEPSAPAVRSPDASATASAGEVGQDGRLPHTTRVDAGPALSAVAAAQVMCDAATRHVVVDDGAVLNFGRRRRKVSPAQLRALQLRDRGCRVPGCGRTRFLHAHHVHYWSLGGPTDLDNLILLCSACHASCTRAASRSCGETSNGSSSARRVGS